MEIANSQVIISSASPLSDGVSNWHEHAKWLNGRFRRIVMRRDVEKTDSSSFSISLRPYFTTFFSTFNSLILDLVVSLNILPRP
jgi:hypothetical protein